MTNPISRQSIAGATTTTIGEPVDSLGHYHVGLFVKVIDPGITLTDLTVTVQLETSPDAGDTWASVQDIDGTTVDITSGELEEDPSGDAYFVGHVFADGVYGPKLRANLVDYNQNDGVDVWVVAGGNAGQGRKATSRKGPVSNL